MPTSSLKEGLAGLGAEIVDLRSTRTNGCESFEVEVRPGKGSDAWTTDRTWMFEPPGQLCEEARSGRSTRVPETTSMMLADGTSISFELVRSAGASRPDIVLSSGVVTGPGEAHRILADRHRRYFGYTVTATPVSGRQFQVEVGPLRPETRARLSARYGEMMGDAAAIAYPAPEVVASGEPLLLELLVNPKTGEKLSDVLKVTAPVGGLPIQVVNGALHRNGVLLQRTGTARGRVGFDLEGAGRFTLVADRYAAPGTTSRPPSSGCVPAVVRHLPGEAFEGAVTFDWRKDRYEWLSRDRIIPDGAASTSAWMCVEGDKYPLRMTEPTLKKDGRLVVENGPTVAGDHIFFCTADRGRFVFSPPPKLMESPRGSLPAKLVDNRVIEARDGRTVYEWTSREPIVRRAGAPRTLWMRFEPGGCAEPWVMGAFERTVPISR